GSDVQQPASARRGRPRQLRPRRHRRAQRVRLPAAQERTRSCRKSRQGSQPMTDTLVYLNGTMVPAAEAHLSIYDCGVVLGATVTEMTRTFKKRPFRLMDHLDRLFRSLRYTRMDIGMSREKLASISQELLAHNARALGEHEELGLIHFVTAGEVP